MTETNTAIRGSIETGWLCPTPNVPCDPDCGDELLRGWEICDSGGDDGCTDCNTVDIGYSCPNSNGVGGPCTVVCGNGILTSPEECDDGDTDNNDGCSSICEIETGYVCDNSPMPSQCIPDCGDDLITGTEVCDDGNT